jgi:hypothetical protein
MMALSAPVSGSGLVLSGPGGKPTAVGAHADIWELEKTWFDMPVVSIRVRYSDISGNIELLNSNPGGEPTPLRNPAVLGDQLENDSHLLFDSSIIASVTDVVETPTLFTATVNFIAPTSWPDLPGQPEYKPAFRAVSLRDNWPEIQWDITYEDGGSIQVFQAIIPEPSVALFLGLSWLVMGRRERR